MSGTGTTGATGATGTKDDLDLTGKVALVTGASSGIGRGIAEALAAHGADIAVNHAPDAAAAAGAEETARRVRALGQRAYVVVADVGMPEQVTTMFAALAGAGFGKLDILVNNAGIGGGGPIHEADFAAWERVIRTNLHGPFLCAQQAARGMIARGKGGRIVNITSVHQEAVSVGSGAYCASKAGLRNLTRTLALELGPHGITSNNVAPGMILTPMNHRAQDDPAYLREAEAQIPVRRIGQPADIGGMVVFLCSDAGSYCTGSTFFVDGGWMLTYPPV